MVRGLRAPLSPREEATLLRVAQGNAGLDDVADDHLRRLMQLELVYEVDGMLALTEFGLKRIEPRKPQKWIADLVEIRGRRGESE